jgi:hypothetical protein
MPEMGLSGSEGGVALTPPSLPLSSAFWSAGVFARMGPLAHSPGFAHARAPGPASKFDLDLGQF